MTTGGQLTAQNVVPLVLNQVYFQYPAPPQQDAFFAAAADAVFTAVTSGKISSPVKLIQALGRAANEGRLLYASDDPPKETQLIKSSRMSGIMPATDKEQSVFGVFLNDNTGSKKSYYMDMKIDACRTDHVVKGTITLTSSLTERSLTTCRITSSGATSPPQGISAITWRSTGRRRHAEPHRDRRASGDDPEPRYRSWPPPRRQDRGLRSLRGLAYGERRVPGSGPRWPPLTVWTTPMSRATPVTIGNTCG